MARIKAKPILNRLPLNHFPLKNGFRPQPTVIFDPNNPSAYAAAAAAQRQFIYQANGTAAAAPLSATSAAFGPALAFPFQPSAYYLPAWPTSQTAAQGFYEMPTTAVFPANGIAAQQLPYPAPSGSVSSGKSQNNRYSSNPRGSGIGGRGKRNDYRINESRNDHRNGNNGLFIMLNCISMQSNQLFSIFLCFQNMVHQLINHTIVFLSPITNNHRNITTIATPAVISRAWLKQFRRVLVVMQLFRRQAERVIM